MPDDLDYLDAFRVASFGEPVPPPVLEPTLAYCPKAPTHQIARDPVSRLSSCLLCGFVVYDFDLVLRNYRA